MKITAQQKHIRMTPQKVRLVTYGLRGMQPEKAITELGYMTRRAAEPVSKVIRQALANAVNNLRLSPQSLKISEILIDEGSTYKRWQAVSRGRAHSILKRTSHIKVILETTGGAVAAPKKTTPAVKTDTKKVAVNPDSKKKTKTAIPKASKSLSQAKTARVTAPKVNAARRTNTQANNSK